MPGSGLPPTHASLLHNVKNETSASVAVLLAMLGVQRGYRLT